MLRMELAELNLDDIGFELDEMNIVEYEALRKMRDEVVEGQHNLGVWLEGETNKIDDEITARSNQAVEEIAADVKYANKMAAIQQASGLLKMESALRTASLSTQALQTVAILEEMRQDVAFMLAMFEPQYQAQKQTLDAMLTGKQSAMKFAAASGDGLSAAREERAAEVGAVVKPEGYKSREAWEAQRQQELDAKQPEVNAMRALLEVNLALKSREGSSYLQRHGMFAAKPEVRSVKNDNNLSDTEELNSSFSNSM